MGMLIINNNRTEHTINSRMKSLNLTRCRLWLECFLAYYVDFGTNNRKCIQVHRQYYGEEGIDIEVEVALMFPTTHWVILKYPHPHICHIICLFSDPCKNFISELVKRRKFTSQLKNSGYLLVAWIPWFDTSSCSVYTRVFEYVDWIRSNARYYDTVAQICVFRNWYLEQHDSRQ